VRLRLYGILLVAVSTALLLTIEGGSPPSRPQVTISFTDADPSAGPADAPALPSR